MAVLMAWPAETASWLLPLVVVAPLLGLVGLGSRRIRAHAAWLVPALALPGLLAGLGLPDGASVALHWLLAGTALTLDATGRVFLLLAAFLWLVAGAFSAFHLAADPRRHRFYGFFLAAMAGNLGLTLATDPVAFLAFFALMGLAAYGLVVHAATPAARRASHVYIAATLTAEMLLFAGLITTVSANDGRVTWPSLVVVALGIKAALIPVHFWLPLTYAAAPAPAAAVLAGSMTKAAILGWLRFLPLGQAALPGWGELLLALGLAGAFGGVAAGLLQRDPKALLAYSSISQIGWMTTAVGAGLIAPAAWPAIWPVVLASVAHHGLAKGALFLGAGVAGEGLGSWGRRILVAAGLVVPGLSLAGWVASSGAAVKWGLKKAMVGVPALGGVPSAVLLTMGAAATALLMARFAFLVLSQAPRRIEVPARHNGGLVLWWAVVAAGLALPWAWPLLRPWHAAALVHWPTFTWPVAAALVLAAAVAAMIARWRPARPWTLPAGDVYVLGEWAWAAVGRWLGQPQWARLWVPGNRLWAALAAAVWQPWRERLTASDRWSWRTSGTAFLLILLGVVATLTLTV